MPARNKTGEQRAKQGKVGSRRVRTGQSKGKAGRPTSIIPNKNKIIQTQRMQRKRALHYQKNRPRQGATAEIQTHYQVHVADPLVRANQHAPPTKNNKTARCVTPPPHALAGTTQTNKKKRAKQPPSSTCCTRVYRLATGGHNQGQKQHRLCHTPSLPPSLPGNSRHVTQTLRNKTKQKRYEPVHRRTTSSSVRRGVTLVNTTHNIWTPRGAPIVPIRPTSPRH